MKFLPKLYLVLSVLIPHLSYAQSASWNVQEGAWNQAGNWVGGVPLSYFSAAIINGGTASVASGVTGTYYDVSIGRQAGPGTLNISGGLLGGAISHIGRDEGSLGTVNVTSGTWTNSSVVYVGNSGTGILDISGGLVSGSFQIGETSTGAGTVLMSGGTMATAGMFVGNAGTGTMSIANSYVSATSLRIGNQSGSKGFLTLSSGTLNQAGTLYVGYTGEGTVALDGGVLNTAGANFAYNNSGIGTFTMNGGVWNNNGTTIIGSNGTAFLTLNGGQLFTTGVAVGSAGTSKGLLTVAGGTLSSTGNLGIGTTATGTFVLSSGYVSSKGGTIATQSGQGTALVSGGTWASSSAIQLGQNAILTISGSIGNRGVVTASNISGQSYSSTQLNFDGGVFRAMQTQTSLFGSLAGSVRILAGGAFIDTNGFDLQISSVVTGTGALTKEGEGTLLLRSINTYSGGTEITGGVLQVGANATAALGTGAVTIRGGALYLPRSAPIANTVFLAGGTYQHEKLDFDDLANSVNATSLFEGGYANTSAKILQGTMTRADTITTSFATTSAAQNDGVRISDVYTISGLDGIQFVLELSIDELGEGGYLAWLNGDNEWVNAIKGNSGGGSGVFFDRAYNPDTDFHLGYYGIDTESGSVWAVIDHNSSFAIAVPEPATWIMIVCAGLFFLICRPFRALADKP